MQRLPPSIHAAGAGVSGVALDPTFDVPTQLAAAGRSRRFLDCGNGSGGWSIPAEDIRQACFACGDGGDPFGVRIANAVVRGTLDLRAASLGGVPLHFAGCTFESAPVFEGADLHELAVTGAGHGSFGGPVGPSRLPGLLANGVRIRRDLVLSGTLITGAHATSASLTRTATVWLTEAQVGGRLLAVDTKIIATGDRAIQMDRTQVSGDVRLIQGFRSTGEVRLLAVQLGGSLDLTAATLLGHDGRALDLAEATIGGSLFIIDDPDLHLRPSIHGRVEMSRATVNGRFLIRNADLQAPPVGVGLHDYNAAESDQRAFLIAPRLTVHGELFVERETVVRGGMFLQGADLKGGLRIDEGILWNAGDIALDLSQASIGAALSMRDALIQGTVNLANARIRGPVILRGSQLDHPHDARCIVAVGVNIDGDLDLRDLTTRDGNINLRSASVASVVDAAGANLTNPGDATISLHHAHVGGNVRLCHGFTSVGLVVLNRAVIDGRLRCDGGTFTWARAGHPSPTAAPELNVREAAFEAISAVIGSGVGLGWRVPAGAVDFTDARTTYLADDPRTDWPGRSHLSGFGYERFAPLDMAHGNGNWDPDDRIRWLAGLKPYDPRPWEQVGRVLRSGGDHRGAEKVLIAQRRHARRVRRANGGSGWRAVVDWLTDVTVRYGFKPHRAIVVMLLLIALVTLSLLATSGRAVMRATDESGRVYSPAGQVTPGAPPGRCGGGAVRCFNPVLYAIDTVVPIIDLHQRSTWYPSRDDGGGFMEWWLSLCTILGWIASTIFALSFTRLGRPNP